MAKGEDKRKNVKKKGKSLKEKRAAKKEKKRQFFLTSNIQGLNSPVGRFLRLLEQLWDCKPLFYIDAQQYIFLSN